MKQQINYHTLTKVGGIKHTIKDFDEYSMLIEGSTHNIKYLFNKLRVYYR
jgi:hypothetical protein